MSEHDWLRSLYDECDMGAANAIATKVEQAIEQAREQALLEERQACADVALSHKGSASKQRQERGQRLSKMSHDEAAEIQAEERGEDIAAEIIAKSITARGKALTTPTAQAEVRKRIVAEWLEEHARKSEAAWRESKGSGALFGGMNAARTVLAALKEQE